MEDKNKLLAKQQLWERGVLVWKLDSCQRRIYYLFNNTKFKRITVSSSRRIGKSFTLLVIALEQALSKPGSQIKYAASTQKAVREIIHPTLQKILEDCPLYIKPTFDRHSGAYIFPNGSRIVVAGLNDGNAESLRGTDMHLGIVDEAGFVDRLKYAVNSILFPQTTTTKGRMILCSTPPVSSNHEFADYMKQAQMEGSFVKKTIYDWYNETRNDPVEFRDRITAETIEDMKQAVGGEFSSDWRREYMVEMIIDAETAIFPEFDAKLKSEIIVANPRPAKYDPYVSLDFGWGDYHAVLFAFLDFKRNKLVIEDELFVQGKTTNTQKLSNMIKEKELELWGDPNQFGVAPYLRIADDDMITLNDMQQLHNLTFLPTKKDNRDVSVNEARIRIGSGDVEINPRCEKLIFQLETGTWAKGRDGQVKRTFTRQKNVGHHDLLDALIYLIRNVQWHKNPYPHGWNQSKDDFISPMRTNTLPDSHQVIKNIFSKKNNQPSTSKILRDLLKNRNK